MSAEHGGGGGGDYIPVITEASEALGATWDIIQLFVVGLLGILDVPVAV